MTRRGGFWAKISQAADAGQSPSVPSLCVAKASSATPGGRAARRLVEDSLRWKTNDRLKRAGYEIRVTRSGCETEERVSTNGLRKPGYKNRVRKNKIQNWVQMKGCNTFLKTKCSHPGMVQLLTHKLLTLELIISLSVQFSKSV